MTGAATATPNVCVKLSGDGERGLSHEDHWPLTLPGSPIQPSSYHSLLLDWRMVLRGISAIICPPSCPR